MDEDSTLSELKNRISMLKEQRGEVMNQLIAERKEVQLMQGEMLKLKKQKGYLDGLIKQKLTASKEYDRIITQSERTLQKLSENTKKLLLSVDSQYGKFLGKRGD